MLSGIVLIDDFPFRLDCKVSLRKGKGDILISAFTNDNIEEVINNAINFSYDLSFYLEREFPDLSLYDLLIKLYCPGTDSPITGGSYGLLLSLGIMLALTKTRPTIKAVVTGYVDGVGQVLDVGGMSKKRQGAVKLGFDRIVLPTSQLDFFSKEIIQIPVSSIYEAFTAVTYEQSNQT